MSIDNREEAVSLLFFFFNDSFLFQWFKMAEVGEIVKAGVQGMTDYIQGI